MKKLSRVTLITAAALMASCGGYTEEQAEAADTFCECMDNEGDFDINFYECEVALLDEYGGEIMADEAWGLALDEKCPDVAGKIVDSE